MPGTVVVKVQPATERFAIQTAAGWLVLSDGLKVLRSDSAQPEGLIQLQVNLDPRLSQTPGSYLSLLDSADAVIAATAETATAETATDEDAAASRADTALDQLVQQLEDTGLLDSVTLISLQDMEEINFLYQGRVSVVLGTANNLPYKLQIASRIVLDTDGTGLGLHRPGHAGRILPAQRRQHRGVLHAGPDRRFSTQRRVMTARDASGQDGGDAGTDSAGAGQTDGRDRLTRAFAPDKKRHRPLPAANAGEAGRCFVVLYGQAPETGRPALTGRSFPGRRWVEGKAKSQPSCATRSMILRFSLSFSARKAAPPSAVV